jgi:RNA polymerase sigma-70 factor (ECF subfamily)
MNDVGAFERTRCDAAVSAGVVSGVNDDDGLLARRAAAGDQDAFRLLVDRHYDACLRFAALRLQNRHDAEDVVQEAFVRMYRSLPAYEERGRFKSWLFQILVNRCRTKGRALGRRPPTVDLDAVGTDVGDDGKATDGLVFWRLELRDALEGLPDGLREAFLLKHVEGWSYDEMATLTGVGVSALKMRVSRAREQLEARLDEVYHD